MTPGARIAAAIEVLDAVLGGAAAERALTGWARRSRFAGSGDRRAVRDHVYDALRRRRSYAALGGADTGRGLMIGALRHAGLAPEALMTGLGHAPAPPTPDEAPEADISAAALVDMPDWLFATITADLGAEAEATCRALRDRAPVFVRVNTARGSLADAMDALARDRMVGRPVDNINTALEIIENAENIKKSQAYLVGLIELQDASSQAAVLRLPLQPGHTVLDFCAGGGGKALALAARGARVTAHDALPARMRDLPLRAARAGVDIPVRALPDLQGRRFDLVLVDAPCSGSGTWRRDPDGKWQLTPERLQALSVLQGRILDQAAQFVRPGGVLAYATCSVLQAENAAAVAGFAARHPHWRVHEQAVWRPGPRGDGFFLALLKMPHDSP